MKDEGNSLGRVEPVKDDEKGVAHRVSEDGLILRRDGNAQGKLFDVGDVVDRCGGSPLSAPQRIEADPRDDGGQPPARVLDLAGIRC